MTSVTTNRNNGDDERIKKHYEIMNIELLLRKRNDSVTRIQIQLIKKCKLQINRLTKQCHSKSYDRVAMNVGVVSDKCHDKS